MGQAMAAVRMMLANHEPFPAVAIDRAWNVRRANCPFERLTALIAAGVWSRLGGGPRNLMRLFFHPHGIKPYVTNWQAIAPLLWNRACREAEALGGQEMKKVLAELGPLQDSGTLWAAEGRTLVPVLPLEIEKEGLRISLFTVIATFGTPQDITADELRLESFFPAGQAAEGLFRSA